MSSRALEAFSDGVFAIAATLLVLDLHVQARPGHLASALGHEWPHYVTFVVSFLTIGIIWVNHHGQFHRIAKVDRTLLFLNLPLLMFVVLIPFPTDLLASYLHSGSDQHVAAALYSGNFPRDGPLLRHQLAIRRKARRPAHPRHLRAGAASPDPSQRGRSG